MSISTRLPVQRTMGYIEKTKRHMSNQKTQSIIKALFEDLSKFPAKASREITFRRQESVEREPLLGSAPVDEFLFVCMECWNPFDEENYQQSTDVPFFCKACFVKRKEARHKYLEAIKSKYL